MITNMRIYSHLSKIFEDKVFGKEISALEGAKNQELAFQLLLQGCGEYEIKLSSDISPIYLYKVGFIPSDLPNYEDVEDDNYLTYKKGLFPDVLLPCGDKITLEEGKNTALWICTGEDNEAGTHEIKIELSRDGKAEREASVEVKIHEICLGEQKTIFTQWFHADCVASVHNVEVFSSEHWSLMEKYISLAARHGINMLLTPVLTPPLDTEVGAQRPTVQLVDITLENGNYSFNFDKLVRYAKMARKAGIKYFEINHLFSQWGASAAPKVMATVNGEYKQIFGWDTSATSEEYERFLRALVPQIIDTLCAIGVKKNEIYFHVSDEPGKDHLESYAKASALLSPLVCECEQIDALSDFEFFNKGLVRTPVVSINHMEPFIEHGVPELWGYYCCAQNAVVSNRFFDMPSARNRIMGVQIYKHGLRGFLHWGYNFYYTQLSKRQKLNPYEESDAGGAFPSGDAFSVYPLESGVTPSLRLKVFKYALDDVRLLELYESKNGRLATLSLIKEVAKMEISFKKYPRDEEFFEELTHKIFKNLEVK